MEKAENYSNSQFYTYRKSRIPEDIMKELLDIIDPDSLDFKDAIVSHENQPDPNNLDTYSSDQRQCKSAEIRNKQIGNFIFQQFSECNMATKSWQYDLDFHEYTQYLRYAGNGNHFGWHDDIMMQKDPWKTRKLSMTIMLSHPDDYEGGEFEFAALRSGEVTTSEVPLEYGDCLIFSSNISHRVKPVTSGVRNVLVSWAWGPLFR